MQQHLCPGMISLTHAGPGKKGLGRPEHGKPQNPVVALGNADLCSDIYGYADGIQEHKYQTFLPSIESV
ncbi:hypothetical protein Dda_3019 [Drechslerella dactyloides]|uniref:Uncharacterized protein n=1 Tax=Drechslerella dactyloides TaxID=74499 RepID=A0AAD6J0J6_DREDA|nr:hypothetical protein Dda_3019 [Drechslerella dactyloides]